MSVTKLTPPIKWHGGKHYLAERIIALMPPRCANSNKPAPDDPGWVHYVEPYFGGGSVLLANDPTGISEVVNDINGRLVGFYKVLQDPGRFELFERRVQATPFSEAEWMAAHEYEPNGDPVADAVAFFINTRQSLAGRGAGFASITRNRTRRGMNEQASAWLSAVEGLAAVHARLLRVTVLNHDARDVIRQQDGPRTLFYLDPPYLHETRTATNVYRFEMTDADHWQLLEALQDLKGKVILSGYRSALYDRMLSGWSRTEIDMPNNAAGGDDKARMTEVLWCNFGDAPCSDGTGLFGGAG